jgi:hypothetical protein
MAESEKDRKIREFKAQGQVHQKSIEEIDSYSLDGFTPKVRAVGEKTKRQLATAFPEFLKDLKHN